MSPGKRRLVAPLGGVVVGVAIFVGVNVSMGRAIVPTVASVSGLAPVDPAAQPGAREPAKTPYQAVCSPCHQPEGQGIPYAFPPLAGSEWMIGDPETPIRIVLLGLSGEIEVKGAKFNLVMPPAGTPLPGSAPLPPLDDAMIAEAITYARTNFGNNASAVDAELVKKVRDSLGGRTTPWTAAELTALRAGTPGGGDAAKAGAGGTAGAAGTAPADRATAAPGKKGARAQGRAGSGPR
jgi:mono/diheme cytochrome c family protein